MIFSAKNMKHKTVTFSANEVGCQALDLGKPNLLCVNLADFTFSFCANLWLNILSTFYSSVAFHCLTHDVLCITRFSEKKIIDDPTK